MSDEIAKYGTFFASDFQSEPTTIDKQPPVCVDCGNPDAPYIVNLPQQGEIGWLCEDCNRQFEVNRKEWNRERL